MKKSWKDYDYKAVNLPRTILDDIDVFLESNKFYSSRAEFIKFAIKEKLERENLGV